MEIKEFIEDCEFALVLQEQRREQEIQENLNRIAEFHKDKIQKLIVLLGLDSVEDIDQYFLFVDNEEISLYYLFLPQCAPVKVWIPGEWVYNEIKFSVTNVDFENETTYHYAYGIVNAVALAAQVWSNLSEPQKMRIMDNVSVYLEFVNRSKCLSWYFGDLIGE